MSVAPDMAARETSGPIKGSLTPTIADRGYPKVGSETTQTDAPDRRPRRFDAEGFI
jgi:hypothetical protein